jgi:hypothetical protein
MGDNIKTDLREIWWEVVHLAQDKGHCRAFAGNFLTS